MRRFRRIPVRLAALLAVAAALFPAVAAETPRVPRLATDAAGLVLGGCQIVHGDDAAFELFTARPAESEAIRRLGRFNGRLAGVAVAPDGTLIALTRDGALAAYADDPLMLAKPDDRWNMLALAWHDGGAMAVDYDGGVLRLVRPEAPQTWRDAGVIAMDDRVAQAALVSMEDGLHLLWSGRSPDLSRGAIRHMAMREAKWVELDPLPLGDVRLFAAYRRRGGLFVVATTPHPLRDGPDGLAAAAWRNDRWERDSGFAPPLPDLAVTAGLAAAMPSFGLESFLVAGDGGLFLVSRGTETPGALRPSGTLRREVAIHPATGETGLDISWTTIGLFVAFLLLLLIYCRRSRMLSGVFPGRPPDLTSRAVALAVDWVLVSVAMSACHAASGDLRVYPELMNLETVNFLFWITLAAFAVYATFFEGLYGCTPGKRLAGMRVRSVLGGPPRFFQALARNAMRAVDMFPTLFPGIVGAAVALFNPRRQRAGDMLAATIVRRHLPLARRKFLLASASPRRRELLSAMGFDIRVEPQDVDEDGVRGDTPEETARMLAEAKGRAAAESAGANMEIVVAADTVVALDGEILGKPRDAADASRMLNLLSGRSHAVITGVMIWDPATGQALLDAEYTEVEFRRLSQAEIDAYVATGDPMDKAGAYGVQTGHLVKEIRGSLSNVAGLPMEMLRGMLGVLDS